MAKITYIDDNDNIWTILNIPENFQVTNTNETFSCDYNSIIDMDANFWVLID